jgi:hypothetical protein
MNTSKDTDEFLAHFGVKGMRWGVRKSDDGLSTNLRPGEPGRSVQATQKLSAEKALPSNAEGSSRKLTSEQKKALLIGGGILATAAVAGGLYYYKTQVGDKDPLPNLRSYVDGVMDSKQYAWGESGFFHPSAYERSEFSLPTGHVFSRVSTAAEDSFARATYTTHNEADYNRYVGFGFGSRLDSFDRDLYRINFTAKEPIRVPDLRTTLGSLREVMDSSSGRRHSDEEVRTQYTRLSGGEWRDELSTSFINNLKSKGYSAIVDEMDAGVNSDSPLVLFNRNAVTNKVSTVVSVEELRRARESIMPVLNPKLAPKEENSMAQSFETADNFLAHFGVKGMRWGVRKDSGIEGVSPKTNREAKKDAEEFTRAKLFYGEGAGTRRKLIKAKVEARSKIDPAYKKAFDHHVGNTDLGQRASQAKGERRRKDVVNKTTKTARGVHRSLTGGFGSVPLVAAILAGGYTVARNSGADRVVINNSKKMYNDVKNKRQSSKAVDDLLKDLGLK